MSLCLQTQQRVHLQSPPSGTPPPPYGENDIITTRHLFNVIYSLWFFHTWPSLFSTIFGCRNFRFLWRFMYWPHDLLPMIRGPVLSLETMILCSTDLFFDAYSLWIHFCCKNNKDLSSSQFWKCWGSLVAVESPFSTKDWRLLLNKLFVLAGMWCSGPWILSSWLPSRLHVYQLWIQVIAF